MTCLAKPCKLDSVPWPLTVAIRYLNRSLEIGSTQSPAEKPKILPEEDAIDLVQGFVYIDYSIMQVFTDDVRPAII